MPNLLPEVVFHVSPVRGELNSSPGRKAGVDGGNKPPSFLLPGGSPGGATEPRSADRVCPPHAPRFGCQGLPAERSQHPERRLAWPRLPQVPSVVEGRGHVSPMDGRPRPPRWVHTLSRHTRTWPCMSGYHQLPPCSRPMPLNGSDLVAESPNKSSMPHPTQCEPARKPQKIGAQHAHRKVLCAKGLRLTLFTLHVVLPEFDLTL